MVYAEGLTRQRGHVFRQEAAFAIHEIGVEHEQVIGYFVESDARKDERTKVRLIDAITKTEAREDAKEAVGFELFADQKQSFVHVNGKFNKW